MKHLYILLILFTMGCATCSQNNGDDPPNIREMPGIEYCGPMCDLFKKLDCKPYYEDIIDDQGNIITCKAFCEFEMKSSIQLNPKCLVETLKSCDQIETICK